GDHARVMPQLQVGLDAGFERQQVQLFEAPNLGLRKRLVGHLRKRRAAPQFERLAKHLSSVKRLTLVKRPPTGLDACLKDVGIKLARLNREEIATAHRLQSRLDVGSVPAQRFAQSRNGRVQRLDAAADILGPKGVDQLIDGYGPVGVQQQKCQQR